MKNRRILSLVLAFAMLLGTFSTVFATPSDIVDTDYEEAVTRLMSLDVLTGYPDGSFRPNETITRAEFAAVAVRVKGMEAVAEAGKGLATGFTDVPANHWASGYVATAARLGIVNGIGNNKFAPEAPVKYEEAITMLVRALGYEPAAKEKGAYPFGYLLVANEIKLLENAKGVQGLPATRGFVAQITDNALETAMMVQVGYGPAAKWVVSGSKEHGDDAVYLLDEMGFSYATGLVKAVDGKKETITIQDEKDVTLKIAVEDFDYNYAEGAQVKAWYKGSALVAYTVTKDALVGVAKGGDKIEVAGDKYDVAKGADLVLNGKEKEAKDFTADYAKVALDRNNEIIWAKGYTLDYMVVEEVDGNDVFDFEGYDVNLKGYVLLKDGKTIDVEDIEEEDVLAYNRGNKFAMVYNDSVVGEIERVFSDEFRLDGKEYKVREDAKYIAGKDDGALTYDILADMMDEEEEVEVFFDTQGKVILVKGYLGEEEETDSFVALVLGKPKVKEVTVRGNPKWMLYLDARSQTGKKVAYDIAGSVTGNEKDGYSFGFAGLKAFDVDNKNYKPEKEEEFNTFKKGLEEAVLIVAVDSDGDMTKLTKVAYKDTVDKVELDDTYAANSRLQNATIIFYEDGDKAVALEDAKFTEVNDAAVYVANNRVVALVGDAKDEDTEDVVGMVTRIRTLKAGLTEVTFINGDRYTTETKNTELEGVEEKEIAVLTLSKRTGAIKSGKALLSSGVLEVEDRKAREIKADGKTYELVSGAKLYDTTGKSAKEIRVLDLVDGDKVKVYYDTKNISTFVKYVVRTADAPEDGEEKELTGVVTTVNSKRGLIEVDKKVLKLDELVRLADEDDNTITIGPIEVAEELEAIIEGLAKDEVLTVELTEKDGVVTEITVKAVEKIEDEDENGDDNGDEPGDDDKTLVGKYNVVPTTNYVSFDMPEGEGAIDKAQIDGEETTRFAVSPKGEGRILSEEKPSEVKVTIGGDVYTITIEG